MSKKIDILDKGYVRLVDVMGSDVTVANAARVSFDKQVEEIGPRDKKLIEFLAREGHTSPFRHASLQFEMYMPLFIARQHWKYVVGSDHTMDAWNESSRRYITEEAEFYIPQYDEWRSTPESTKQGSGPPLPEAEGTYWKDELVEYVERGEELYELAMARGVAPEQARLFLPAYGMYVRWYWTASLQSVMHMIQQRSADDAQYEFQLYAEAVRELATPIFPVCIGLITEGK